MVLNGSLAAALAEETNQPFLASSFRHNQAEKGAGQVCGDETLFNRRESLGHLCTIQARAPAYVCNYCCSLLCLDKGSTNCWILGWCFFALNKVKKGLIRAVGGPKRTKIVLKRLKDSVFFA